MCKDNDFSPQITRINTDYFIEKWSQNETGTFRNKKTGKKKMRIAELEETIQSMRTEVINYTDMLSALDKKLKELLNEKINECNDVIDAWETQFEQTKNDIKGKMEQ